MNNPRDEINSVELLAANHPFSRVLFICNEEDDSFSNYVPNYPNIEKYVSGIRFSISKALNLAISKIKDEKYFCFVQSDVHVDAYDVKKLLTILENETLNCGVIGLQKHSNFHKYNKYAGIFSGLSLHRTLWADGIMLFKTSLFNEVGLFNENYFGDKESQEFCYRVHDVGYCNYLVEGVKWRHMSVPFTEKSKINKDELLSVREDTVNEFRKKWMQWEEGQKYLFV